MQDHSIGYSESVYVRLWRWDFRLILKVVELLDSLQSGRSLKITCALLRKFLLYLLYFRVDAAVSRLPASPPFPPPEPVEAPRPPSDPDRNIMTSEARTMVIPKTRSMSPKLFLLTRQTFSIIIIWRRRRDCKRLDITSANWPWLLSGIRGFVDLAADSYPDMAPDVEPDLASLLFFNNLFAIKLWI